MNRQIDPECVFCKRISDGEFDGGTLSAVHFEPLNPVTPGHRLFVPTEHIGPLVNPYGLDKESGQYGTPMNDIMTLLYMWRQYTGLTEHFNLILNAGTDASQTIPHMHLHYIPRHEGDGLVLPWTDQKKRLELDPLRPASTISDLEFVQAIDKLQRKNQRKNGCGDGWVHLMDLAKELNINPNRVRSKFRRAAKRKLVDGCNCGCRGDFYLLVEGVKLLKENT